MKQLLTILLILTAYSSYSQGTFQISNKQAQEAIHAKQQNEVLKNTVHAQGILIEQQEAIIDRKSKEISLLLLENDALRRSLGISDTQLQAEKEKKKPRFGKKELILIGLGFLAGVLLGS